MGTNVAARRRFSDSHIHGRQARFAIFDARDAPSHAKMTASLAQLHKIDWVNAIFLISVHVVGIAATAFYVAWHGVSLAALGLFAIWMLA